MKNKCKKSCVCNYCNDFDYAYLSMEDNCTSIGQVSAAVSQKLLVHLQFLLFFIKVTLFWAINYRIMLCYFLFADLNVFFRDINENLNTENENGLIFGRLFSYFQHQQQLSVKNQHSPCTYFRQHLK